MSTLVLTHPNIPTLSQRVKNGFSWPCLFFGSFWFLAKGMILRAIVFGILAFFTFGLSWLFVPFFANRMLITHLVDKGYRET